jgi:hypothetical protein
MNERIKELLEQARTECRQLGSKPATTVGYDELEQFAELVRQDEREACAKLCEEMGAMEALDGETETSAVMVRVADKQSRLCAAAIRARDMYTKPQNVNTSAECVQETDKSVHDDDDIQEYKRPWVSLTDEEIKDILDCGRGGLVDIKKAEQILKERNT